MLESEDIMLTSERHRDHVSIATALPLILAGRMRCDKIETLDIPDTSFRRGKLPRLGMTYNTNVLAKKCGGFNDLKRCYLGPPHYFALQMLANYLLSPPSNTRLDNT